MGVAMRVITYRVGDSVQEIDWTGELMPTPDELKTIFGTDDVKWTSIRYVEEGHDKEDGRVIANNHAKWPIVSSAAGVNAKQVAAMKKMYPHHQYTTDGRMVFTSQAHQRRCLRDIGMRNHDDYMR